MFWVTFLCVCARLLSLRAFAPPSIQQEGAAGSFSDGPPVRRDSDHSPDEGGRVAVDEQPRVGQRQPLRAELRHAPEGEAEAQREAGGRL